MWGGQTWRARSASLQRGSGGGVTPPTPPPCKNSWDLYQFKERPLSKVGGHCPPPMNISATRQTYMAVYMLGLRLGLFSALLGPAHFAMIRSGHGHLCLTGCRNSAPSTQSTPWRRHSLGTRRKRTHADDVAQVADVGALGGDEFVDDVTDV